MKPFPILTQPMPAPRIAVGGFMLESNARSPLATREEFRQNFVARGPELEDDWKSEHPRAPLTLTGFVGAMDASGPWSAAALMCAMVGASGPVEQRFFIEVVEDHVQRLRAAMPVDGVFLSLHGGAIAEAEDDPEGVILESLRAVVGPGVPIVATLDLHANVSRKMADNASLLVAYRTNPHVDMAERGAECAALMREMLGGVAGAVGFVKLPFIPPSVAQNTKSGPYADLIAYGQSKMDRRVMNVSVVSGFSLGGSVKNGMRAIGTTRGGKALAPALARGISAGQTIILGAMALLQVGGIRVVVVSVRHQAKDTAMFECFGIRIADARSLVVKSRGHFRAAFDLLFSDDRIVEVDAPGLTTPILTRVPYRHVPRPIYPLDPDMTWSA